MFLVVWMLNFKSAFLLPSLTLNKRLLSFSLLSAIRGVSSAYLRLLIFLSAIIPGSYAILLFTASDFTFSSRQIQNWAPFLLWLSCFILSGAISNCPLLLPSSILNAFWPGGLIVWCHIFLPFYTVHGILTARILEWFVIPSSSGSHFVRTLHYDLSALGGPAWHQLIASLTYASPFTMTRLWSMKGHWGLCKSDFQLFKIKGRKVPYQRILELKYMTSFKRL